MQQLITVYKDRDGFYPDGCQKLVDCGSAISSITYLNINSSSVECVDLGEPGQVVAKGSPGAQKTVKVIDPTKGIFYVDFDQIEAFKQKCGCCVSNGDGNTGGGSGFKIEGLVGGDELTLLGILGGDTVITHPDFAGHDVLVFREYTYNPGLDPGGGSAHHTKVKADDFLTLNTAIQNGDYLCIVVI